MKFAYAAALLLAVPLYLPRLLRSFWVDEAGTYWMAYEGLASAIEKCSHWPGQSILYGAIASLFCLDVEGPWRDPQGFNFPVTTTFDGWQLLPTFGGTIHLGALFALLACVALAFLMAKTLKGFEIKVTGNAPRAGRFAGFSRDRMVMFCFLLSGGLAGLAGICEVASVVTKLQPQISPGYGFAAIIVAFLGRLNPIGVLFAGLLLALSYIGGEAAQVTLGISDKIAKVFQGILLFFILACDTLILYRIKFEPTVKPVLVKG